MDKLIVEKGDLIWLHSNGYMTAEQVGIYWDQLQQRCAVVGTASSETKQELHEIPRVAGSFLGEPKQYDICIAYSLKSGRSLAESLQKRLIQKGRTVSLICEDGITDIVDIEKRVAIADSLIVLLTEGCLKRIEVVFSILVAKFYYQHSSLVMLVHDAESCFFPGREEQPYSIQDFFNEKAITYLNCYPKHGILEILEKFDKEMEVLKNIIENYKQKPEDGLHRFLEKNDREFSTLELRQRMKPFMTPEQLDEFVARVDINKDGVVDSNELQNILGEIKKKQDVSSQEAASHTEQDDTEDITTRVFLSHKRTTGQGIAGRLYEGLKSNYKIFIDSEAKDVLVFILSEGIFLSKWCFEELKSAIETNKRVIVVRDLSFKFPDVFPSQWTDVEPVLRSAPDLVWLAEYNTACVQALHVLIGAPDERYRPAAKWASTKDGKATLASITSKFEKEQVLDLNNTIPLPPSVEIDAALDVILPSIKSSDVKKLQACSLASWDSNILIMGVLSRLPNLLEIDISRTAIMYNEVVEEIAERYPQLESLSLQQCVCLSDQAAKSISNLKDLRRLNLNRIANITDTAVEYISQGCLNLEVLKLGYTSVTERAFSLLDKMPVLKELELPWNVKRMEEEVAKYKEAHSHIVLFMEPLLMDVRHMYTMEWWQPAIAKSFSATEVQVHYYGEPEGREEWLTSHNLRNRTAAFHSHREEYGPYDASHPFTYCDFCATMHSTLREARFLGKRNNFFINEWYFTEEEGLQHLQQFIDQIASGKLVLTTGLLPEGVKHQVFLKFLLQKSDIQNVEYLTLPSRHTEEAKDMLVCFPHIRKLALSFPSGVSTEEFKQIVEVMPLNLTELIFGTAAVDNETAPVLAAKYPNLEVLRLKHQHTLTTEGFLALIGENSKLKIVSIQDNSQAGLEVIERLSTLKELTILDITLNQAFKEDVIPVLMKGFPQLKNLSLDWPIMKSPSFAEFKKSRPDIVVADEKQAVKDINHSGSWYPAIQIKEDEYSGRITYHVYGVGTEVNLIPGEDSKDKVQPLLTHVGDYGAQDPCHFLYGCFYCSRLHSVCEKLDFADGKNLFFINDWYFDGKEGKELVATIVPQGSEEKLAFEAQLRDGVYLWALVRAVKKQLQPGKLYMVRFGNAIPYDDVIAVLDQDLPLFGMEFNSIEGEPENFIEILQAKYPKLTYLSIKSPFYCLSEDQYNKLDLPELTYLDLKGGSYITDNNVEGIAKCKKLEQLFLAGTQLTEKVIQDLAKNWTELKTLSLRKLDITDETIRILAENCPKLQSLNIVLCNLTLDSLKYLEQGFPNLKEIKIPLQLTGSEQLDAYKASHPSVSVIERSELVDARDYGGQWFPALMLEESADGSSFSVHYYGNQDYCDRWITKETEDTAAFLTNKQRYGQQNDSHCASFCKWCQYLHPMCRDIKFGTSKNLFFINDWYMESSPGKALLQNVSYAVKSSSGKLDLTNVKLPEGVTMITFAKAFVEQFPSAEEIKKVCFSRDNTLEMTRVVLGRVYNLEWLQICNVTDEFVPTVVEKAGNLTHLALYNSNITDDGFKQIISVTDKLQSFFIRNCPNVTDNAIEAVVQKCQKLQDVSLDLTHQLTAQSIKAVYQLPQLQNFKSTFSPSNNEIADAIEEHKKRRPEVSAFSLFDGRDRIGFRIPVLVKKFSEDRKQAFVHYFGWPAADEAWLPLDPSEDKIQPFLTNQNNYGVLRAQHFREDMCELCKDLVPHLEDIRFNRTNLSEYL